MTEKKVMIMSKMNKEWEYDELISVFLREKASSAPPDLVRGVRAGIGIIEAERAKFVPPPWLTRRFYRYAPILMCVAITAFFGITASMRGFSLDIDASQPYDVVFDAIEETPVPTYSPEARANLAIYEQKLNAAKGAAKDATNAGAVLAPSATVRNSGSTAVGGEYAAANYIVTGALPGFMHGLSAVALSDGTYYYAHVPAKLIDSIYGEKDTVSVLWVPNA
jgi:hypothetical protein